MALSENEIVTLPIFKGRFIELLNFLATMKKYFLILLLLFLYIKKKIDGENQDDYMKLLKLNKDEYGKIDEVVANNVQ